MSLIQRYLKDSEVHEIALEVATAATESRNNAISSIIETFYSPSREVAEWLYDVYLTNSQTRYISKLAQINLYTQIRQNKKLIDNSSN